MDQFFDSDLNNPLKQIQFQQVQEAFFLYSKLEETNYNELKELREKSKITLFENIKLSSKILYEQEKLQKLDKGNQMTIEKHLKRIQSQKDELDCLKKKHKAVLSDSFNDSANYKALFLYLVQEIYDQMTSPI